MQAWGWEFCFGDLAASRLADGGERAEWLRGWRMTGRIEWLYG